MRLTAYVLRDWYGIKSKKSGIFHMGLNLYII